MGGGIYEFAAGSGALVGQAAPGSGAIFLSFECALNLDQQPASHSAPVTQPTAFSVIASGTGPVTYQWRKNGQPLSDGGRIAGSHAPTLAINPTVLADMSFYDVLVSNGCRSIASGPAELTVFCYPNGDGSIAGPVLNVNDFICFQTRFVAGESYANCDGSTAPPVLNVNDFICFQTKIAQGCP